MNDEEDVSDDAASISDSLRNIARAIGDTSTSPFRTDQGGSVSDLVESGIFIAVNIGRVADAINRMAEALEERNQTE